LLARPIDNVLQSLRVVMLSALFSVLMGGNGMAQSFVMADGAAWSSCAGSFFDSGGPSGNYANNEDLTATLCPAGGSGSGSSTSVTFTAWAVQAGTNDQLFIHDGTSTAAPLLVTGSGANSLLGQTVTATGPTGCLTFRWVSDGSTVGAGWEAAIVTGPDAGTDASVTFCSAAGAQNLFSSLGGTPDAGGSWTAPGGGASTGTIDPATAVPGGYVYTVSGAPGCANASATVTVSIVQAPDAGGNGTLALCSTSAPASLFNSIAGSPDAGGTWTAPGGGASTGIFTPGTSAPGVYTYTVAGSAPCVNDQATVTVTVNAAPNAGTNGTFTVCSNAPAFDLFTRLGGTPQSGGSWTGPGGVVASNTYTPGTSTPGVYTYTVTGIPPCPNASATVTVTQVAAPNAGISRALAVCSDAAPFSMRAQLNGTPQPVGVWTDPLGAVHADLFEPAVDIGGVYTYTVTGTPPCANAVATLTITRRVAANAGTNGSVTVCSTDADLNLITILGGSPDLTGTWTEPGGGAHSGVFQPGTDPAGVYTYTVPGQPPCANRTATVTVTVNTAPNAGTNASVLRCSDAANFNLFNQLGGTPNSGGVWTGPGGGVVSATFDPGVSVPGIYTYTVTGLAPCANATATVNVSVIEAPDAGSNGSLTVCSTDPVFNLLSVLGGTPDAVGTWTAPGGGATTGTFTPGSSAAGTYTYTVAGTAPCVNDVATATIAVSQAANAGTNGSITLCSDDAPVALFGLLGGSPSTGGTWTRPGGTSFGGTYDPANANHPAGVYTYTVTAPAPCPAVSATVQVVENTAPNAGNNGTITVCSTNAPFNLISVLGGSPDLSGSWLSPSLAPVSGVFTPGVSTPGIYRYVVPGTAPCENDTARATVVLNTAPNAGTNGSLDICSTGAPVALLSLLGGSPDAGGAWTNPNNQAFGGTYDPANAAHLEGVYTYTVAGLSPCANASAFVVVNEERQPVAGTSSTLAVCSDAPPVDLLDELGGNPDNGGTWTGPGGTTSSGVFIPSSGTPGAYTYTVAGVPPCVNATATVTITVNQAPFAGSNGSVTVCNDQASVDLFAALGGGPDAGGTWADLDNTGQLSGQFFSPLGMAPGSYDFRYTVPGTGQCNADIALVEVTIVPDLEAGSNGTITVCSSSTQVNLFTGLGGSPQQGGTWQDLSGTGALSGQFFNASVPGPGVYSFKYKLTGTLSCASDSATVTVTVVGAPSAGNNGTAVFCSNGSSANLFPFLGGTPQSGGNWTRNGNPVSGIYNPVLDNPGTYTYTVSGTPPCPNATATVTVSEVAAPNAGCPTQITTCSTAASFSMRAALTCNPSQLGTWTDPLGQPHGDTFVPGLDLPGVYIYTVTGTAPCANATAALTITVNQAAFAGNNVSTTVCSNAPPFLLFGQLTGSPAPTGTWTGPLGQPFPGGLFTPGTSAPGVYTYTVTGVPPCANDDATVTVFVNQQADAGTSSSVTLCAGGGAVNLFTLLGGTPSPTGTWTTPGGLPFSGTFVPGTTPPGTYTYTVPGVVPCAAATSTVTVAVSTPPNAGCSATFTTCSNAQAFALIDKLGCTPALNGTWTAPGGAPHNGVFTPGSSVAGTYTYTVPGTVPCVAATATVTVVVNPAPNAGCAGVLTLCSTSAAANLFNALGCAPQTGGTWTRPGGLPHSGTFLPSVDPPGVYTYTVAGQAPCVNATATVTVTVNTAPDAGSNGLITICESALPFPLINVLNGSPQLNGTWTNPLGQAHNGVFIPGVDPAGSYTYAIAGTAPCASASAVATVVVNPTPDAGSDDVVTVCSDQQPFLLIDELGGTPDLSGAWTAPGGLAFSGVYVPGTSVGGVYTYVVPGLAPCTNDTARVTVVENTAPDAGLSTAAQLCTDAASQPLVDLLLGDPDGGGTWTGPGGVAQGPVFDPATGTSGTYTYTVIGFAPCVNDQASVQISLFTAPDAGGDGVLAGCVDDPSIVLFDGLVGAPQGGGTWTDDDNSGGLSNGVLSTIGLAPGTYDFTYTVAGAGPCVASTATVTVQVASSLDAGADNTVQVCESETAVALFPLLGGTPQGGGLWLDVDNSGALTNGTLNALVAGIGQVRFTYVIPASASCSADSATVTVQVLEGPFAGTDAGTTLCSNTSGQVDLFSLFGGGPDAGGTWTDPSNAVTDAFFAPGIDPPGAYTYTVPAIGNCPADAAVVTVQVTQAPDAGSNGTLTVCSNGPSVNMFLSLQGTPQPGGSWTTATNVPHPSTYNPAIDVPGVYTYTVPGQGVCPSDQAVVVVTENQASFAGLDNALTLCSTAPPFQLFTGLAGNPQAGGSWTDPGGDPHGPVFDPAIDVGGVYTYTVNGIAPCANDQALLTINLTQAPYAGMDSTIQACASTDPIDLFAVLGPGVTTGGTWTDVNGTGALSGDTLDPTLLPAGSYTFVYTVLGSGPCPADDATVIVAVGQSGFPGIGGSDTLCGGSAAYNLFNSLSGGPDPGGVWADVLGTGALNGALLDLSALAPGSTYPFTYTVSSVACGDATASVLITTTAYPDPGGDTTLVLCSTDPPLDLFDALPGTPDTGGVWTDPFGIEVSGLFVPGSNATGKYAYSLTGSGLCNDTSATMNVIVQQAPNAGTDGEVQLCNTLPYTYDLFNALGPSAQPGGVWTDLDGTGALTGSSLAQDQLEKGVYDFMYVVNVPVCGSDTALVEVTINEAVEVVDTFTTCIARDRTYQLHLVIDGGIPSTYVVTGLPGTLTTTPPYTFISEPLLESETYTVYVRDGTYCNQVTITGGSECVYDDPIYVPESFSPNGDGINDVLVIPGIEGFPGNTVSIFNRWGNELYRASGYDNRSVVWDGVSDSAVIEGLLPTGTYYYVVDLGDGSDVYKGFIFLNR
jgi:gliding motility-associated-like protein